MIPADLLRRVRRIQIKARKPVTELLAGEFRSVFRGPGVEFDELREYCYRVASTVGLVCIEILGYRNPTARAYAVNLGVAFQLTNILRDVGAAARRWVGASVGRCVGASVGRCVGAPRGAVGSRRRVWGCWGAGRCVPGETG